MDGFPFRQRWNRKFSEINLNSGSTHHQINKLSHYPIITSTNHHINKSSHYLSLFSFPLSPYFSETLANTISTSTNHQIILLLFPYFSETLANKQKITKALKIFGFYLHLLQIPHFVRNDSLFVGNGMALRSPQPTDLSVIPSVSEESKADLLI